MHLPKKLPNPAREFVLGKSPSCHFTKEGHFFYAYSRVCKPRDNSFNEETVSVPNKSISIYTFPIDFIFYI